MLLSLSMQELTLHHITNYLLFCAYKGYVVPSQSWKKASDKEKEREHQHHINSTLKHKSQNHEDSPVTYKTYKTWMVHLAERQDDKMTL